jgi:glycosyltransferase involved in cell wall biosynthesis
MKELPGHAYMYVLPPEIEGLSTGLLEAMAYRNCVLVSGIEENLEAVAGNGVSFEAKNVNDLKDKLEFLMGNPVMVQEYGEKARRQAAEAYDWEAITSQFEALYVELLREK